MENETYCRGELYYIENSKTYSGNLQGGDRPVVIVSNDIGNETSSVLEVVFLTTKEKAIMPTHVRIASAKYPSIALCEQITTINKERVKKYLGKCSDAEIQAIDRALAISIGLETYTPHAETVEKELELARVKAERDVYRKRYEELTMKK